MTKTKTNQNTEALSEDKPAKRGWRQIVCVVGLGIALASSTAIAQGKSPEPNQNQTVTLTLDQAVEFALSHYPAVKAVLAASRSKPLKRGPGKDNVPSPHRPGLAGQPGNSQQCVWPLLPSAHPFADLRTSLGDEQRNQRLGNRHRVSFQLGTL